MKDSDQNILNMMGILDLPLAIDKYQELIVDPNLVITAFPSLLESF